MILVYHRVADAKVDPFALSVSPKHFAQQLEVLKSIANPISLRDLVRAESDQQLPERPICITFDDGYADNLHNAKPAMIEAGVPGTVFVTPGYLDVPDDLWWDELTRLVLDPKSRRDELNVTVQGTHYSYVFPQENGPESNRRWKAWDPAPGPRQTAYLELHTLLIALSDADRAQAMEQLRGGAAWFGNRQKHRCLTEAELRELAFGDIVEIGAHTLTHPVLSTLTPEQQQEEIGGSKRRLEEMTGKRVTSFAYPYGKKNHYSQQTVKTVQANGFDCACSNFGGLVTRTSNRFALPRFQPMDWEGDRFAEIVESWYRE
jgi:peptidoglycan/xylan/chitin deacetylase (PgdA/CDA1 family)